MSTASPSLIAQLAQRARYMSLDQVPPAVIRQAQWCVLDTLGCILAGADTEESRLLAGYCDAFQSHGGAGLRGVDHRLSQRKQRLA